MGQTKSKNWRRLSDSDCLHLLNDNELNNSNHLSSNSQSENQDYKSKTLAGATMRSSPKGATTISESINNLLPDDGFMRAQACSASCTVIPSSTDTQFSSFSVPKFSSKAKVSFNKNLQKPKNENGLVSPTRKSFQPCFNKVKQPLFLRHPTTPPPANRFFSTIIEPEMLLRPNKNNSDDQIEPTEKVTAIQTCDLIESPPPLPDFNISSFNSNVHSRPITMYQLDRFEAKVSGSKFNCHSSLTRGLSFNELLEECNTFEDSCEEFSDQTLVDTGGTLNSANNKTHMSSDSTKSETNCLLVDIASSVNDGIDGDGDDNLGVGSKKKSNCFLERRSSNIRCSGLDCICDRCVQHRFKLLNWLLPNCTRVNAERLLHGRMEGTFLVRKSEKFPGQYTLSFVCRRTVRHCLIMRSVYGFGLRWPYSFETLQQVIIHYARTTLAEFNSKLDVQLRYPVFMS